MNSGKLVGRLIARNVAAARRNYGGGNHFRQPTMNDLPTPAGDFFAMDAARQRTNNSVLALGIVMFTSTVYLTYQSKLINFNYSPPETYE